VNAIDAGITDPDSAKWLVVQGLLEREIAMVKKAKAEHSGRINAARLQRKKG